MTPALDVVRWVSQSQFHDECAVGADITKQLFQIPHRPRKSILIHMSILTWTCKKYATPVWSVG